MSVQWNQNSLAIVCIVVAFVGSVSSSPRCAGDCQQPSMSWNEYKILFNKSYSSEEDARRRDLFQEEQIRVNEHNSNPCKTHELAIDFMSDWNNTEFQRTMGPLFPKMSEEDEDQEDDENCDDDDDCEENNNCDEKKPLDPFVAEIIGRGGQIPCTVDWRRIPNRVSPVKFQLGCGACWAFATTGMLEGQQVARNITNRLIELSEQQLIDCKEGGNGCAGGFGDEALKQIVKDGGIMSEKDYPYATNWTAKCRFDVNKSVMKVKGLARLPVDDEDTLAIVVARYGPVAVSMDMRPLRGYRSGIITVNKCDCSQDANHEALIVGYGTEDDIDYWLVKNSWSAQWGADGYFKIERGQGVCGIAKDAIIATF